MTCAALVALSVVPSLPSSGAARGSDPRLPSVGVQFHGTWAYDSKAERVEVLEKLRAAGVRWVRIDLSWERLQRGGRNERHRRYLARADQSINLAHRKGFKVMVTYWGTPGWANGGKEPSSPPRRMRTFRDAARWVADRYRGKVQAWEIWNEPNHPEFWKGTMRQYVRVLRAGYRGVKEGAPGTTVTSGGTSFNDYEWLQRFYAKDPQRWFDVLVTNPYMSPADLEPETPDNGTIWTIAAVRKVRRLMVDNGDRDKRIWFGEFGWSSHPNDGTEENWQKGVTLEEQADYLVRALRYIGCNFPYVRRAVWYAEKNRPDPGSADKGEQQRANYGLLTYELEPKPAYDALANVLAGPRRLDCSD
ncbi:MAG TPA: cellulase family glycosylhydrolase [Actinomycetota bacterium]|nr:cellulase family glycosylhydrolase [Actinomycetota bacterium]